jgi:recombinational DNA repair ATPase RecF
MEFGKDELAAIIPSIKVQSIENEGVIKKAELNFKKGLNIIIGENATGKTTALKAIVNNAGNLGVNVNSILNSENHEEKIGVLFTGILGVLPERYPNSCLVIDDFLGRLSEEKRKVLLKSLINSKVQVITATIPSAINKKLLKYLLSNKVNIIQTEKFILNN